MAAKLASEDDDSEPTQRVVGTVASHLEDRIGRTERHLRDLIVAMDRRVEQRFDDMEKATTAALAAADKANTKAETAAEKRFDNVNEFREQLREQAGTFLARTEAEARLAALSEKVDRVISWQERNEGQDSGASRSKASSVVTTNMVIAGVGLVIAVLMVMLNVFTGR